MGTIANSVSEIQPAAAAAAELRHRLHMIPELGFAEFKTAALIRQELTRLGIQFIAGVEDAPTATVAHIGDLTKPCIALRADIDALPITEQLDVSYISTHPGQMHACGHDGHIATLLGTAKVLKAMESQLNVCVKLFWQPAEEGGGGGERLVKAGLLDGRIGPPALAIFGLHGWPGLPVGKVSTRAGALLAATDSFSARFVGTGTHAAYPHTGRDPIVAAAEAVINLQQVVSRDFDPTEPLVITIGKFHAGTATNVIPDLAVIEGTVRTLSESSKSKARQCLDRRLAGIAAANGCTVDFEWFDGYPATINDPKMASLIGDITRDMLGETAFIPATRPSMGGEDFAYYLEKIPGCFFLIGTRPQYRNDYPPLHSDLYDFTDASIEIGLRMFVGIVRHFSGISASKL